jgi:molecular chaperone GrpE
VLKGVHLTLNDILKILERHHVTPIKAVGEPFDPNYHQAMMQVETDDQPPNTVVDELQKGYMIHERLLRPTLVSVSKAGRTDTEHND